MNLKLIPLALLTMTGCAASPYAWKDLGDGEGMRGWAGIPLRYSVPASLAAGAQAAGNAAANYQPSNIPPVNVPSFNPEPITPIPVQVIHY
jgi:hypothetical protein